MVHTRVWLLNFWMKSKSCRLDSVALTKNSDADADIQRNPGAKAKAAFIKQTAAVMKGATPCSGCGVHAISKWSPVLFEIRKEK